MSYKTLTRVIILCGICLVIGDLIGFAAGRKRFGGPCGAPVKIYRIRKQKGRK